MPNSSHHFHQDYDGVFSNDSDTKDSVYDSEPYSYLLCMVSVLPTTPVAISSPPPRGVYVEKTKLHSLKKSHNSMKKYVAYKKRAVIPPATLKSWIF